MVSLLLVNYFVNRAIRHAFIDRKILHCQKEKLADEAALTNWLEERCMSRDELLHQLSLPIKLSKLALDSFGNQAEARFLQRKEALDQVTYSLLRVKDSGIAHELYLQLEAGEASFESLASNHSEGPEKRSSGRVGPGSLMRAHPQLRHRQPWKNFQP